MNIENTQGYARSGSLARMRFAAGTARSSATLPNCPFFSGFVRPGERNRATGRYASCTTARSSVSPATMAGAS